MEDEKIERILYNLSKSNFRSRFKLQYNDKKYIEEKGIDKIREHANDFITKRLSLADMPNDGKQTPMKGHPVFIAQHATATCCRECLYKWHKIEKNRALTEAEKKYVVDVIMEWIKRQYQK